ncbi:MAG: glycosyltransferase family 2 protein [Actinomycetota bacterium]
MPPAASIVIPVHNALQYTTLCVESIERNTPEVHEIVLVDNASTDGTAEWFTERGEGALIRNSTNRGFAGAVNAGMSVAEGDVVVILNNDTLVTPGWLTALIAALDRDPAIGITAPMSNYVTGGQIVYPVPYGRAPNDGIDAFGVDRARAFGGMGFGVERLAGLCMAISRRVIDTIGGFDPAFAIGNFEDDDYSIRARLAGFRLWVCQDSYIHHFGSRTFDILPDDYDALLLENSLRFAAKWELPPGVGVKSTEPTRPFDPARDVIPLAA